MDSRVVRRILVVDDNEDAADMLAGLLELSGHQVRIAHDGPQALEVARAFAPQVVLLDIGLPGMSGYEVAREMRRVPGLSDAVLMAQTGWSQPEDVRQSRDAGFDFHLVKPLDPDRLERLLAELPATGRPTGT